MWILSATRKRQKVQTMGRIFSWNYFLTKEIVPGIGGCSVLCYLEKLGDSFWEFVAAEFFLVLFWTGIVQCFNGFFQCYEHEIRFHFRCVGLEADVLQADSEKNQNTARQTNKKARMSESKAPGSDKVGTSRGKWGIMFSEGGWTDPSGPRVRLRFPPTLQNKSNSTGANTSVRNLRLVHVHTGTLIGNHKSNKESSARVRSVF